MDIQISSDGQRKTAGLTLTCVRAADVDTDDSRLNGWQSFQRMKPFQDGFHGGVACFRQVLVAKRCLSVTRFLAVVILNTLHYRRNRKQLLERRWQL